MSIQVTLPDGSVREVARGTTALQVAESIGPRLAKAALAAKVNGEVVDLSTPLHEDAKLAILTWDSAEGREVFRHTSTHIMAQAVKRLWPEAKLTVGPPLENGYFYDIDIRPLTPEDLEKIEEEMRRIIAEDLPIQREEVSRAEALKLFEELGETYKIELINELPDGETISLYRQGEFVDLCRGPHLPSTGRVKAPKLMSVAGAYWRGDQNNQQLQRLYGTSFPSQKELEQYLFQLEEAKRRDHRKLGQELELFSLRDESPGMPFWHPKGMQLWNTLQNWSRELQARHGYQEVSTPQVLKTDLWHRSGHYNHYRDNMYFMNVDEEEYGLKPMNCPCHCLLFSERVHSYRELPIRIAEYGRLHRYELSGALHGLLRVRTLVQDDAHIFCREDQIEEEIRNVLGIVDEIYSTFGMKYTIKLSTRPDDYMGDLETWNAAEASLERALRDMGRDFELNPGDGAFYGPKLDFDVHDSLGRVWQCATVQLDFQMPRKFELKYTDADGKEKTPVMIHRAIMGSLERFIGILIEHFAGAFPVWLAPEQVRVLPITDRNRDYAEQVVAQLREAGIRASGDWRNEKVNYKIREAQLQKVPFMLVVGDKEEAAGTVAVRRRESGDQGSQPLADFIAAVQAEVKAKALPPVPGAAE